MAFQSSLLLEGIKTGAITPKGLFIDTSKAAVLELKNESNELVGLTVGGKVIVQRGDIIELSKEDTILESESGNPIAKCKVLSIRKSSRPYDYEISFFHSTLSSLFVLPLLNFDNIKSVNLECFVNVYVAMDDKANMEDVYLLYRYNCALNEFEEELMRTQGFVEKYDVHYDYVVYKFKLAQEYRKDVYNFTDGKYSEMSDKAKSRIMNFHGFRKGGTMHGILYITPERKKFLEDSLSTLYHKVKLPEKAELFSRPDIEIETLNTSIFDELS